MLNFVCTRPVKQSLPVHPLIHVQVSGAVHCLFLPHGGIQIAVLLQNCIMCLIRFVTMPVKQSLPVHPLTHVQVLGAVHCLFVPQLQGAVFVINLYNEFKWICNHTC